jgi:hypothetical protein
LEGSRSALVVGVSPHPDGERSEPVRISGETPGSRFQQSPRDSTGDPDRLALLAVRMNFWALALLAVRMNFWALAALVVRMG